jgi:predicted alpha/beta superfamily hydrolase
LLAAGRIEPIIIVAVENAGEGRIAEYTPTAGGDSMRGGRGNLYAKFLVEEVKPLVDRVYRTRPQREYTAVAGSSLGGLITLYLGQQHSDTFGKLGILSPSLWWDERQLLRSVQQEMSWAREQRIWLDMGSAEDSRGEANPHLQHVRELARALRDAGLRDGEQLKYIEAEGAQHNEAAWAARFGPMLEFLFPAKK